MTGSKSPLPNAANLAFVEEMYARYLGETASVPKVWQDYFRRLSDDDLFRRKPQLGPTFRPPPLFRPAGGNGGSSASAVQAERHAALQDRVDQLIRAYRERGHMIAQLDPLGRPREGQAELYPPYHGLGPEHMDLRFSTSTIHATQVLTLKEIVQRLRNTYCRSIGVQFMHISDASVKEWLQWRMEGTQNRIKLGREEQLRILTRLTDAVIFEAFIQKKFLGAKSFSLEGGESLIPLLDMAIEKAATQGVDEIVIAMAHRGRLNVLANIMRKSPRQIFLEFEDPDPKELMGRGDVKYHLGYSSDWVTSTGRKLHLTLCFNPSHLEFVNPVALGRVRAKQDRDAGARERKMGLLIHGDAAFAGEGIVQETLNLSELAGYSTGGTLHVVVNNQIGFTTLPEESRSSPYCTEVAKMLEVPIFHVNGEDPEAVAQVIHLAMDFRKEFQRDVFIDMYCYRRRGHNEGDEPSFTQPQMYRIIEKRPSVREGYLQRLLEMGEITKQEADEIAVRRREQLERDLAAARRQEHRLLPDTLHGIWEGYVGGPEAGVKEIETGVGQKKLAALLDKLTTLPPDFHPHPKIERFLEGRREMAAGRRPLDWAAAEALAFASLADEGTRIRLSGQDAQRGTFSQRHAVLHDVENDRTYTPLQHLAETQGQVEILNSPLSEAGVLGFEYGYSLDTPDGLVIWEAQFGDFANAAQVIIDQFIVSAEEKWQRLSGIVLLLPHGFEGMGPEHSSARLERFLLLSAEDNIQVCCPTTPAQYFHLLRRQVLRPWRKPLVVMTPKSLLRHPRAVCSLEDLAGGTFQRILPDDAAAPARARRVLLCSGKVFYDLLEHREEIKRFDTALLRMEQLYPLSDETLQRALKPYRQGTPLFWVQEEPENMGAWRYLRARFGEHLLGRFPFRLISRPVSASPATGSPASHKLEQRQLVERAFQEDPHER